MFPPSPSRHVADDVFFCEWKTSADLYCRNGRRIESHVKQPIADKVAGCRYKVASPTGRSYKSNISRPLLRPNGEYVSEEQNGGMPQYYWLHSWTGYTKGEIYGLLKATMCFIFTREKTWRMRTNSWVHMRCWFSLKCSNWELRAACSRLFNTAPFKADDHRVVTVYLLVSTSLKKEGFLIFRPVRYLYKPAHLLWETGQFL